MTTSAPTARQEIRMRLGDDWHSLADILEIPRSDQRRWDRGHEAREIEDWLQRRNLLHKLPSALIAINRQDLAKHAEQIAKQRQATPHRVASGIAQAPHTFASDLIVEGQPTSGTRQVAFTAVAFVICVAVALALTAHLTGETIQGYLRAAKSSGTTPTAPSTSPQNSPASSQAPHLVDMQAVRTDFVTAHAILKGKDHPSALVTKRCGTFSGSSWNAESLHLIGSKYRRFRATLGLTDDSVFSGSLIFTIRSGNDILLVPTEVSYQNPREISVDVSGMDQLLIEVHVSEHKRFPCSEAFAVLVDARFE